MTILIRPETDADHEATRHVNCLAFGQDDEARLVDALRDGGYSRVSLVAEVEGRAVGHILFNDLPILTETETVPALALAPLAVLPEYQRRGIGSALVRRGLEVCRDDGHRIVVVLGHPHFYPRFGFSAKVAEPLTSPFCGRESWMALELVAGALDGVTGWVRYPPPFGISAFTGTDSSFGSLIDGRYSLTVDHTKVAGSGQAMASDFTFADSGATTGNQLYRLYGDANGDRVTNGADLSLFISVFGGPNSTFDFNADNVVNGADLTEFIKRFGLSI